MSILIMEFDPIYQSAAVDLVNTGLGEHFGFIDASMNPDLYDIEFNYKGGDFLIALAGEQLVGTGSLLPIGNGVGQIARMHTKSDYRRCGVATKILEELELRALDRGLSVLALETNVDWQDANSFYLRNSYIEIGRNDVGIRYRKVLARKSAITDG